MFQLKKLRSYIFAAGHLSFFLLFHPLLVLIVSRGRSLNQSSSVDGSSIIQILYLSIILLYLLSYYLKNGMQFSKVILFKSPITFFFAYIVLCSISTLWSINPYLTFYRSIESITFLFLIITTINQLIHKYNIEDVISWTIFYAFWNLIIDTLYHLKLGQFPFSIPFLPSRLFFPLFIFIIINFSKGKFVKFTAFFLVLLGLSNKIFIGIAVSFFSFMFGNLKNKLKFVLFVTILIVSMVSFGFEDFLLNTLFYGRDDIGLEDSSGRNHVWSYLFTKGLENPLYGFGYVSGETFMLISEFRGSVINAHNAFLSAFLGTGILGVVFVLLFFISIFIFLFKTGESNYKMENVTLSSIILITIVSNSGPGIGGRVYGSWIPSVFIIVLFISLRLYQMNRKLR